MAIQQYSIQQSRQHKSLSLMENGNNITPSNNETAQKQLHVPAGNKRQLDPLFNKLQILRYGHYLLCALII